MIIYNFRYNGPYEYDKFILNICQLYNIVEDEKETFAAHELFSKLKIIGELVSELTQCDTGNTLTERMLLLRKARGK